MNAVALHHVLDGPPAAPVVLLAGPLGSDVTVWQPQVAALAERFRVLRVDLRGHGRSPAPPGPYALDDLVDDVVALLDGLGLARVHAVGLSLGGMVGLRLAAREPRRVDRLAVLCSSARPDRAVYLARAALVREQGTAAVVAAEAVGRWFTANGREPGLVARMEAMVGATPAEGYAACCEAIAGVDLRADLASVAAPTLLLAGAEDPAAPPEHLRAIAAGVRGARVQVLPGAAHVASVEQAAAVNAALLAHLDPAS